FTVSPELGVVSLDAVAGYAASPPEDRTVNVVFSHIRPQPGMGYDERRYVSLWGRLHRTDGHLELVPDSVQHWDEQEMTFFEFSERGVPQAHKYMERLSRETGRTVRPRLSPFWLFLRATRLPFLSATIVPIGLGIAVAGLHRQWHWWLAILTIVAGACVHLGLNVVNAVFLGFGPIMALGAYYVQARHFSWEAVYASVPVGILVALILYVNEVPDRPGDAAAGKRTLPVRLSKEAVVALYALSVAAAFG